MKGLYEIARSAASGLILYGVIWALENTEVGRQRLLAAFDALTQTGERWSRPLSITAVASAAAALVVIVAARAAPVHGPSRP